MTGDSLTLIFTILFDISTNGCTLPFGGIGLGILLNLLNPEKILLGGGVMASGELLLRPTLDSARNRSYKATFDCCSIERASLGNDAGIIGSAAWAVRNRAAELGRA